MDEAARHQLYTVLEQTLGEQPTSTLMSLLPPVGWADVATKDDVRALGIELRGEIAEVRGEVAELRGEVAELRGEIRGFRGEVAELRGEIGGFRGEVAEQFAAFETRITGALRQQLFAMVAAMSTVATLTVAAASVV